MDKVLKRRLIGASILIALAVIFVPMLLVDPDSVDGGSGDGVNIPPMPESAREVRRIPLDPEAARVAEPGRRAAERDPAPDEPEAERSAERLRPDEAIVLRPDLAEQPPPEQRDESPDERPAAESGSPRAGRSETDAALPQPDAAPESAAAESQSEEQSSGPASEPEPDAVSDADEISLGDWIVQVASFASRESSEQVRERLESLGHSVARDEIVRGQLLLYRLRTGPYTSREAADNALEQISATVAGVEPIVRQIDRGLRAGMESGFAVQVGSFVSEDNAESETERLTGLDFEAFRFSEEVGERLIWRVMVGPVADRDAADALKSRLADQADVEGLVVSY